MLQNKMTQMKARMESGGSFLFLFLFLFVHSSFRGRSAEDELVVVAHDEGLSRRGISLLGIAEVVVQEVEHLRIEQRVRVDADQRVQIGLERAAAVFEPRRVVPS